jgi:hypothetical protein
MSTRPAVTMQSLELEHAELLPSRETLWVCHPKSGGYGSLNNILSLASGNVL